MISLNYSLDKYQLSLIDDKTIANASISDLTVYLFCGDVMFSVDDSSFDARWGWIPVLDFAIQAYDAVRLLNGSKDAYLHFTENEDYIQFSRIDTIHADISASYTAARATTLISDLEIETKKFLRHILADLSQRWPSISNNQHFRIINEMIRVQDTRLIQHVLGQNR